MLLSINTLVVLVSSLFWHLEPESILFGPTALTVAVKGIIQHIETKYGPLSNSEDLAAGELQTLHFEVDRVESGLSLEDKRATLVKRIVYAFVRECLDMPLDL